MDFKRLVAKGLRAVLQPPAITNCAIHSTSKVCSGSQVNNTSMDRYSYIGHDVFLVNAEIGSFCSIADNCRIGGASHDITRVSTSPVFSSGKNIMKKNFAHFEDAPIPLTTIGHDVWIGAGATVLSGVNIGTGAVVGAGSVVTKDVSPYAIVAGNPAKLIRYRFTEETVQILLKSRWWEWSESEIQANASCFNSPTSLFDRIGKSEAR